jgi:hypothetical protein
VTARSVLAAGYGKVDDQRGEQFLKGIDSKRRNDLFAMAYACAGGLWTIPAAQLDSSPTWIFVILGNSFFLLCKMHLAYRIEQMSRRWIDGYGFQTIDRRIGWRACISRLNDG